VDSVTFCLSKALCAPVGSVLCGTKDFIYKARRLRKQLGGGMRQAGVLSAAGIIAIETISLRLGEDHKRARRLAEGVANIPGFSLAFGMPPSNMIFIDMAPSLHLTAQDAVKKLVDEGIKIGITGDRRFRMVTHYWIDDAAVERTIKGFSRLANL
jgi:threonine aldolase